MSKNDHVVNHRSVLDRRRDEDISQAPALKRLVEIHSEMKEEEKARTLKYLKSRIKRNHEWDQKEVTDNAGTADDSEGSR